MTSSNNTRNETCRSIDILIYKVNGKDYTYTTKTFQIINNMSLQHAKKALPRILRNIALDFQDTEFGKHMIAHHTPEGCDLALIPDEIYQKHGLMPVEEKTEKTKRNPAVAIGYHQPLLPTKKEIQAVTQFICYKCYRRSCKKCPIRDTLDKQQRM